MPTSIFNAQTPRQPPTAKKRYSSRMFKTLWPANPMHMVRTSQSSVMNLITSTCSAADWSWMPVGSSSEQTGNGCNQSTFIVHVQCIIYFSEKSHRCFSVLCYDWTFPFIVWTPLGASAWSVHKIYDYTCLSWITPSIVLYRGKGSIVCFLSGYAW